MEVKFEKLKTIKEDGEEINEFVECSEEEATHKVITYKEESLKLNLTMGQELPSKRIKL